MGKRLWFGILALAGLIACNTPAPATVAPVSTTAAASSMPAIQNSPQPATNTPLPTAVDTLQASRTLESTRTATATGIPTPTATPIPTADRSAPLSENGPWLVYYHNGEKKLVAVNADGSGRTVLPVDGEYPATFVGSPTGNLLAGVWKFPELEATYPSSEALFILSLPELELELIPLFSSAEITPGGDSLETMQNVIADGRPAWSPDGRLLAFTGAIDGPSLDLYVYDAQTKEIRRLTDGMNQAADPEWSPDGKWILHHEVDYWGMGCNEVGFWAARADGSEVKRLLGHGECGYILGWLDLDEFYLSKHMSARLYRVKIASGFVDEIGRPNMGLFFNPWTKEIVYSSITPDGSYINQFLVLPGEDKPILMAEGDCKFTLSRDETMVCLDDLPLNNKSGVAEPSPDGRWFLSGESSLSLYTADGKETRQFTNARMGGWQPDSRGLIFMTITDRFSKPQTIYYVSLPDGEPEGVIDFTGSPQFDVQMIWRPDSQGFFIKLDQTDLLFYYSSIHHKLSLVDGPIGASASLDYYIWVAASP